MVHCKWIRFLSMLVVLLFSITAWGQNVDDFNPDSPGEPGQPILPDNPVTPADTTTYYTLTLLAQEGGSVNSGGGQYAAGAEVQVVANAASTNFVFTGWTNEAGDTISTDLSFLYTMPARNVSLLAHYDFVPGSPAEPSQPDIPITPTEPVDTTVYYNLMLIAEEGGSITAGAGSYAEGTEVTVTAAAPATNFVFVNWTDSNGDIVASERSFSYVMPAHDETLTAHYNFEPGSPAEPSQPDIQEEEPAPEIPTHTLSVSVEEGGTVTVNGTAVDGSASFAIEEGATATIATTLSTNFTFDGWYILNAAGEELYSNDKSFTFTMDSVDVALVARFNFDPNAPSEPSMPTTSNNELYLMSVVGLPGETINYPLYLNSNDTLRDIRFEMQFPVMMVPDFDNVSISPNAVGYTFSYSLLTSAGSRRRAESQEEGDELYANYAISMTGGVTPPGNTALFIVPVTIDENIAEKRHRIWLSQVEVMLNDSTVVGATTRNGAINTDYEEPDSYSYLDNIISVGSTAYSTTQAQQIAHLEPFTVNVPADSIAYILGCSDVSFVTFKGRESLLKITDEQTAENGFWFGKDGYVRSFVADADSMRMAVQYDPDTHVMSIMQYPGAYNVGDADTVKVYFTYKYKYYEVELRLNIDRPDSFVELGNELCVAKDSLTAFRPRILQTYNATKSLNVNMLTVECDSLLSEIDGYLPLFENFGGGENELSSDIYNNVSQLISATYEFMERADNLMPQYVEAFAALQNAKNALVVAVAELAETATQPALDAANALIAEVDAEYVTYDVAKANEMTDSLVQAEIVLRYSVVTNEYTKALAMAFDNLLYEKQKIADCHAATNANDIAVLGNECDDLIAGMLSLQSVIGSVIAANDSVTTEIITAIIYHISTTEEFIARAESIMPLYVEAFAALQNAKNALVVAAAELAETATQPALDAANALIAEVDAEYMTYDVAKANEMTDSLAEAEIALRYSVVTNEKAKEFALVLADLLAEKQKIADCYAVTNANDIAVLGAECDNLIAETQSLQAVIDSLIANNDSITTEITEAIIAHKFAAEEFIARAESIMPLYVEAYNSMMTALDKLKQTMEDLRQSVVASQIDEAVALYSTIWESQPSYSLADYASAEAKIYDMILRLLSSIQSEDVALDVITPGTTEENIANPSSIETLAIAGPLNGSDIRFIREGLPRLRSLDLSKAWIVEGGKAYLDDLYTSDLTIGDRMFAELPQLESLILCDSINAIGMNILTNSTQVSTIAIPAMTQTVASGALGGARKDVKVEWNAVSAVVPALLNGNPNLMVYAVNGVKGEREWQNIIHEGHIESITLRDDYPLYIPEAFFASEVTYARKFTKVTMPNSASGWESIALPFDVKTITHRMTGRTLAPFGSEQECDARFWLGQMTSEGFAEATVMNANTPYLVRMPNSPEYSDEHNVAGVVLFSASDTNGVLMHRTSEAVASVGNGYSFVPTYEAVEASDNVFAINDDYYEEYIPGSVFVRMQRDVRPMEAYVVAEDGGARLRDYITLDMLQPDGIKEIESDSCHDADKYGVVYTLTGIRVSRSDMKRGNIYIINGKQTKY